MRRFSAAYLNEYCKKLMIADGIDPACAADVADMLIDAEHILKTKQRLNQVLAANTGQPIEVIERDTDRDHWLTAEEAVSYGLIDSVVTNR